MGEELKQIKEHGGEPKEDRHASKLESSYDPDEDEDDEDEDENEGLSPKMDKAMTIMGNCGVCCNPCSDYLPCGKFLWLIPFWQ